jgi:hypothetical protein
MNGRTLEIETSFPGRWGIPEIMQFVSDFANKEEKRFHSKWHSYL